MSKPVVAVVGRPNVGKSTLFNALAGENISIVKDTPGVTRDRIYADVEWLNYHFTLIDTGGIEPESKDIILSQMREQAQIAIDTADHFTVFGQAVVAALIQIGGLGVTSVGMGLILAAGRQVGIRGRLLIKEALNVDSFKGMVRLVKAVLMMTLCFEAAGMVLSFLVFVQDYSPLHALWISIFHSIAAFNNSGFDILGGLRNLIPYQSNVLLNLTTCGLIICGGLGFLVMLDIKRCRSFR